MSATPAMFLQFRPVQSADFAECFRSIRNRFAFDGAEARCDLLRLWNALLTEGRMIGAVMEDIAATPGERIVWCCFKVFVTDDFAAALCRGGLPPLPSRQLLDAYRRGEPLPLLPLPEIRRVNSAPECGCGLNMLVTHYGSPYVLGEGKGAEVAQRLLAFTEYFSSGYNVQEILEEFYDDYNDLLAQNAGFCPRTDYARHFDALLSPPDQRPRLLGTNRAEAKARPGTIGASVFRYQKPCFFFRPGDQEMLLYALLGESDEVLAERLSLAEITIRKRWEAIYERVLSVTPDFFDERYRQPNRAPSPAKFEVRGETPFRKPEKKRIMLAYLRHHMEELRPLVAPAPKAA